MNTTLINKHGPPASVQPYNALLEAAKARGVSRRFSIASSTSVSILPAFNVEWRPGQCQRAPQRWQDTIGVRIL
jgi:hypothetical protein